MPDFLPEGWRYETCSPVQVAHIGEFLSRMQRQDYIKYYIGSKGELQLTILRKDTKNQLFCNFGLHCNSSKQIYITVSSCSHNNTIYEEFKTLMLSGDFRLAYGDYGANRYITLRSECFESVEDAERVLSILHQKSPFPFKILQQLRIGCGLYPLISKDVYKNMDELVKRGEYDEAYEIACELANGKNYLADWDLNEYVPKDFPLSPLKDPQSLVFYLAQLHMENAEEESTTTPSEEFFLENYRRAFKYFASINQQSSHFIEATEQLSQLVNNLAICGHEEEACKLCETISETSPYYQAVQESLGVIKLADNELESAFKHLFRARSLECNRVAAQLLDGSGMGDCPEIADAPEEAFLSLIKKVVALEGENRNLRAQLMETTAVAKQDVQPRPVGTSGLRLFFDSKSEKDSEHIEKTNSI